MRNLVRSSAIVFALVAICCAGGGSVAAATAGKMRLAQTSTVTNCMMTCNSQAATCQMNCVIPGTPPTGAATATGNANVSTSCQLNCTTQQVACHTVCARTSPSP
jgi:hypothetical protein